MNMASRTTATGYVLSPADQAKQQARKEAKLAKKALNAQQQAQGGHNDKLSIIKREWVQVGTAQPDRDTVRVLTWNMLAQTLVRRKLFPGSDCLKFKDRGDMLAQELQSYPADIICLQEEDRLSEINLNLPNLVLVQARGPGKLHGCTIMYDSTKFNLKQKKVVIYDYERLEEDEEETPDEDSDSKRRGGTRQTKNIGLILGLERKDDPSKGLVVATTHLFWHPQYSYERTRQALLLMRNVQSFKSQLDPKWPIIVAGDFNTEPDEAVYHLLTHPTLPLTEPERAAFQFSSAIHPSLDKVGEALKLKAQENGQASETPTPSTGEEDDEKDDEGEDEKTEEEEIPTDRPKGTRVATPTDGLLDADSFQSKFQTLLGESGIRSAYGSSDWIGKDSERKTLTYKGRGGKSEIDNNEPSYTSTTAIWRLTLDYLFDFPPSVEGGVRVEPRKILLPHKTQHVEKGLPMKGICASDHTLLGVEYALIY